MVKDYKNTLNLPQTSFSMKANLSQREPEFLRFWEERGIYEKIQEKNRNNKPFILHDGPPYANGHIHIGHALNKVLKDIIIKYKSMKGHYTPYVPGWDCHGLPIEHQVDKKLGKNKYEISILEKRRLCREYADKFVDIQREEFKRLGVFGDWDKPYLTMSFDYEASIVQEFIRFVKGAYVYKGKKPVYWCPSCMTALAEAEVEYAEERSPSIYVSFRVLDSSISDCGLRIADLIPQSLTLNPQLYFVIWTTTPWTLPANLALAVHPDVEYSVLESNSKHYIIGSDLVEKLTEVLKLKGDIVKRVMGKDFKGMKVQHPFLSKESLVVTDDFVTTEEGTGVVHIAPGHGEDDYVVGLKYGLDIFAPVDDRGTFTISDFGLEGKFVFQANEDIIRILDEKGALMESGYITHSYPHCWRCKKPIIFRATEQWFISVEHNGLREKSLKEINRVQWIPAWGRERISGMVEKRPDWCISRQRAWGVPITLITCKNCGEFINDEELFDKITGLFREKGADIWFELETGDLVPEGYSCHSCGGRDFKKETDILDVWFDSGVSNAAVLENDTRLKWPAKVFLEGSDQHRGWFQSSLLTSVGTRGRAPYDTVLTHGFVVDGNGKKMSKSLGNVIAPEDIIKKSGAEILRLWVSAEDYRSDVRLSNEIINRLVEAYRKIRNTCRFLLGNLYDFDHQDYSQSLLEIDRWAMSRLQGLIKSVTESYERFDFHQVFHTIYNFCVKDMSSFYLDILKDRLYTFAAESSERKAAQWTIYQIVIRMTQIMAPVLSYTAEEIWQVIPGKGSESVFLSNFPEVDKRLADNNLEEKWKGLIEIRNIVNKAIEIKRAEKIIGNSLEAKVVVYADEEKSVLLNEYRDFLPTLLIVSQASIRSLSDTGCNEYRPEDSDGIAVLIEKAGGNKCSRCWNWSLKVGEFENEPEICERCYKVLLRGKR